MLGAPFVPAVAAADIEPGMLYWTDVYVKAGYPPWPCTAVANDETVQAGRQRVVFPAKLDNELGGFDDVEVAGLEPFLGAFTKNWRAHVRVSEGKKGCGNMAEWRQGVESCLSDARPEAVEVIEMVKGQVRDWAVAMELLEGILGIDAGSVACGSGASGQGHRASPKPACNGPVPAVAPAPAPAPASVPAPAPAPGPVSAPAPAPVYNQFKSAEEQGRLAALALIARRNKHGQHS